MRDTYTVIQLLKYILFSNVYILIVKSFIYILEYISGTPFRKGELVHRTKFTYRIGSSLKIR